MSIEDPHALDDVVMLQTFRDIVRDRGIKVIVETGINHGLSTILLADLVPTIFAVENTAQNIAISVQNYARAKYHDKIILCVGNSPFVLKALQPVLPDETLYFLDAHWQDYWPLLDEIRAIRRGTGVIVLHDIQVPEHPELGYDSYGGHSLNYDYVKDVLTEWSPTHRIVYNDRVEGTNHPRGVGYVFPE